MPAPSRRGFWLLIAAGTVVEAGAASSFTVAFREYWADAPVGVSLSVEHSSDWTNYVPLLSDPAPDLPWMLAGLALALAGLFAYALAARRH